MTPVAPSPASSAAMLLRDVGAELARRVSHRLPGLGETFAAKVVVVVDAEREDGALGSYTAPSWAIQGVHYDKLTLAVRHRVHLHRDPQAYAERLLTTLSHEIAHAYARSVGLSDTKGPGHVRHTEDFAVIAVRLGLNVLRAPGDPTGIFTPGLTRFGQAEFADLIWRIAAVDLRTVHGTGLAGPPSFTGVLTPRDSPATAASTTSQATPTTTASHDPSCHETPS